MPQQPWGRAARGFLLHTLGLHPPLIAFGSATRGHEEPNFGGFTAKQLPFSYRRNRVTELCLVTSAVPNQAADREGRTWRFPFEGRKSKNIPLCIPLFLSVSVCTFHLLYPRWCVQETDTALSPSCGNVFLQEEKVTLCTCQWSFVCCLVEACQRKCGPRVQC